MQKTMTINKVWISVIKTKITSANLDVYFDSLLESENEYQTVDFEYIREELNISKKEIQTLQKYLKWYFGNRISKQYWLGWTLK